MAKGRKTGGRKPGVGNIVRTDIKTMIQERGVELIEQLISIANTDASSVVRVNAIKELLDRGFGKAVQQTDVKVTGSEVIIIKPRGVE